MYTDRGAHFDAEIRDRLAFSNRPLRSVLATAAAPNRAEWLLNFPRYASSLTDVRRSTLAIGTTSSEALHRELNR
eukprot:6303610-Amphidinium_carterae.1